MTATRDRRWPFVVLGAAAVTLVAIWRQLDAVEVRGRSMAPTLLPGDRLIVTRLRRAPRTGDIVLASDPRGSSRELIKRVAVLSPSGVELRGDNATASTDGRTFGAVPMDAVEWRVVLRYWPPRQFGPVG